MPLNRQTSVRRSGCDDGTANRIQGTRVLLKEAPYLNADASASAVTTSSLQAAQRKGRRPLRVTMRHTTS